MLRGDGDVAGALMAASPEGQRGCSDGHRRVRRQGHGCMRVRGALLGDRPVDRPRRRGVTFDGKVQIAIEVLEPTARITLNALDLDVRRRAPHRRRARRASPPPRIAVDAAAQTATFTFAKPLPPGATSWPSTTPARSAPRPSGCSPSTTTPPTAGSARSSRSSRTPTRAASSRRWDEPAYKATFALEAIVPSAADGGEQHAGRRSAPSSATAARACGSRASPEDVDVPAVPGRGRPRARHRRGSDGDRDRRGHPEGRHRAGRGSPSTSSAAVLREYNDYFGTPYPLPKLDNIAAPGRSQFFGAMENWGAIFTFEYALLVDPSISTEADRQTHLLDRRPRDRAPVVRQPGDHGLVGRPLAQRGLRLLDGRPHHGEAAPGVEHGAGARCEDRDKAMARDALATTHPVVQHVETVEQASQAFDAITYEKGEAVIRMLEGYVGADAWRAGVRRYIQSHAYGNTVSDDLWRDDRGRRRQADHRHRARLHPAAGRAADHRRRGGVRATARAR